MDGDEGRPSVPQHQNKTARSAVGRGTDSVPRPNGPVVEVSREKARLRLVQCELFFSPPIVFILYIFNTRKSRILQRAKLDFITRTATHNTAPRLRGGAINQWSSSDEVDMKPWMDLAYTDDIKAIHIERESVVSACSALLCSTPAVFHGSSAMCCSHGDSKWHVGFARNTGAPPLLNNRPCSDLGDEA